MQIGLFPYTSTGTVAGPRSGRQDERAAVAAPGRAAATGSAGPVDLVAAVGSAMAPMSVLVEAASLVAPMDGVGEADPGGPPASATGPASQPLPVAGEGGAPPGTTAPLAPLGSGQGGGVGAAGEALVLPGSGYRARQPIEVELPGSRPAVEEPGDLPAPGAPPAGASFPGETTGDSRISPGQAEGSGTEAGGAGKPTATAAEEEGDGGPGVTEELTEEEAHSVEELKQRDREVRRHEQAHVAAGGQYVRGGAKFEYTTGPDRKRYAAGGEVSIDTSPVADDPEATIRKAQVVYRAALAPAEPSGQDRSVASQAKRMESEARRDQAEARREETQEAMEAARSGGDEAAAATEAATGGVAEEGVGTGTEAGAGADTLAGAGADTVAGPGASADGGLPPTRTGGPRPATAVAPSAHVEPTAAIDSPVTAARSRDSAVPGDGQPGLGAPEPPELDAEIKVRPPRSVGRLLDIVA